MSQWRFKLFLAIKLTRIQFHLIKQTKFLVKPLQINLLLKETLNILLHSPKRSITLPVLSINCYVIPNYNLLHHIFDRLQLRTLHRDGVGWPTDSPQTWKSLWSRSIPQCFELQTHTPINTLALSKSGAKNVNKILGQFVCIFIRLPTKSSHSFRSSNSATPRGHPPPQRHAPSALPPSYQCNVISSRICFALGY